MRLVSAVSIMLLLLSPLARADVLVGIAQVDGVIGANLEYMGKYTSYYGVLGSRTASTGQEDNDFRWVVGLRKRMDRGLAVTKGFYTGMMIGDLGGNQSQERLGIGGELGHQWVTVHTRTTIGAGLAALEEVKSDIEAEQRDVEPTVFFAVSWSLRK